MYHNKFLSVLTLGLFIGLFTPQERGVNLYIWVEHLRYNMEYSLPLACLIYGILVTSEPLVFLRARKYLKHSLKKDWNICKRTLCNTHSFRLDNSLHCDNRENILAKILACNDFSIETFPFIRYALFVVIYLKTELTWQGIHGEGNI